MKKDTFIALFYSFRTKKSKVTSQTISVDGLGPVVIGYDPGARINRMSLKNESNRPVTLKDLKE